MPADQGAIYLSRLVFNPRERTIQRAIGDCHLLHQTVMRGFPHVEAVSARKALEVLYRPEVDGRTGAFIALVQSVEEPDWSSLRSAGGPQAVSLVQCEPEVKRIDSSLNRVPDGARLRFRLRANPTKRLLLRDEEGGPKLREDGRPKTGPRVPIICEEDQLLWLGRKANEAGFTIADATARPDRFGGQRQTGQKRGSGRMTLDAVVFDGELEVIDANVFRQSVIAGIGGAKAYGFGLLSVGPAG